MTDNDTATSLTNFRNRLSNLEQLFDSYVTLQKEEKEKLRRQNEILKQKKDILVKTLSEHYRLIYECDDSECDYMLIIHDGSNLDSDETSKECNFCSQSFCQKHFDKHKCNYGCSGI